MFGYGFPRYVSVDEKKAKARKALAKLKKSGFDAQPIEEFRGKIATTFWGKSWCENLDSYADYENRVGRGRSYIRNGFICHLGIEKGKILGKVCGTSLYTVEIDIQTLAKQRWQEVCERCAGQIGSLMELLQGKFSKEVMKIVCDKQNGLFPAPREIKFRCSCPDWASMCKHVAAVLYGIGRRLDTEPDLLFTLRGVDPSDLLAQNLSVVTESDTGEALDVENVGELFGIDLAEAGDLPAFEPCDQWQKGQGKAKGAVSRTGRRSEQEAVADEKERKAFPKETPSKPTARKGSPGKKAASQNAQTTQAKPKAKRADNSPKAPFDPASPMAKDIRKLRELAGLTQAAMARTLKVSPGTLTRWENTSGLLGLSDASVEALVTFQKKLLAKGL